MDEQRLDEFQSEVRELLGTVIVMDSGLRVLMVPFFWTQLDKSQQTIVIRHALSAVQAQLAEHPGSSVRLEFEEIPADLRAILSEVFSGGCPVSYGLLSDPPPV